MKKQQLLIAFSAFIFTIQAQQFQWGKAEGKYAYDYGYGAVTDNSGNLYVGGKYEEVGAVFSTTTVPCSGNHDGFLVKYAPNGDLVWINTFGGANGDYIQAVYTDKTNYVYVSGEIESATANTPISFPGSTVVLNAVADNDLVFAKYDLNGTLIWAKSEGSSNSEKALGVAADNSGNVYICGYYTNTTTINGTPITGAAGRNIYVAKYDQNGVFQWFRDAGSAGRDEAKAVRCDASGNVYVCGMYSKDCTFGSQVLATYNNTSFWDAFLAKYDTNGNLQWVKTGGGDVDDGAWSIVVDNQNSIYISGEFAAYAQFSGTAILSVGEADTYVAKYNGNGDLQWIKRGGSNKVDRARGMGTDGTNIFITGQYGGTATFGGAPSITAVDTSDIYIAALDNTGAFKWAMTIGGKADTVETLGYESGNAVAAHSSGTNGAVYATGGLLDGGSFGGITVSKHGTRTDAFVTKITWDPGMPGLPEGINDYTNSSDISLYPNPGTGKYSITVKQNVPELKAEVFNCVGQLIKSCEVNQSGSTTLDLSAQPSGVYLIQVNDGAKVVYRQKLIQQQ
jgi:hypothetical protein